MDQEARTPTEAEDSVPIRIVKEIPLWGVFGVLGLVFIQALSMFFSLQSLTEKVTEMKADLRLLSAASQLQSNDLVVIKTKMDNLEARINSLERKP